MKKQLRGFITIFTIILSLLFSTGTTMAHSGRTDSSGGHKDNKNVNGLGYYHYHHGYGPHLHPNGVCSYTKPVSTPKPVATKPTETPKTIINENYVINYYGKNIKFYDDLIEKDGKVFAPIIQFSKEIGYSVNYDLKSNIIYINAIGTDLIKSNKIYDEFEIYMNNAYFDTSKYKLELINKVVYAPILDYAELLECKITQDDYTKTIFIKWN